MTALDRRTVVAALAGAASAPAGAQAPADVVRELAPTGRLRAAINLGNPVLAGLGPDGEPAGITVDLARELARRLSVTIEFVRFDGAGKVTDSAGKNVWDVAFLAVDPRRAEEISFTAPYVVIEGTYLVREDSPLRAIDDFDRTGIRIAVGRGSAYDLFLTRTLKQASLVRAETSEASMQLFSTRGLEAAAGVKQPLVAFARATPGYRVIPGRFMVIEQAMGTPQGRPGASAYLRHFVEEMKASGFVAEAVARHNQPDAAVAPPASR
ncbi:MAG: periplasmic component of an type amino acid transport system-like protein [Enterovirga sp.]|nr:periplasmic component of an type amino acid transport system-like protein [Enterovirga sp.]